MNRDIELYMYILCPYVPRTHISPLYPLRLHGLSVISTTTGACALRSSQAKEEGKGGEQKRGVDRPAKSRPRHNGRLVWSLGQLTTATNHKRDVSNRAKLINDGRRLYDTSPST